MKYSIKVNEVRAKDGSNIKGFATVHFALFGGRKCVLERSLCGA